MLASSTVKSAKASGFARRDLSKIFRRCDRPVPVRYPTPLYHVSAAAHAKKMPSGWTARVLFLQKPDGSIEAYGPLVRYFREKQSKSGTWQNTVVRGVGLFWDFLQAKSRSGTVAIDSARWRKALFEDFALKLLHGTIENAEDQLGLFWPKTSRSQCVRLLHAIEDFAIWCRAERKELGMIDGDDLAPPAVPIDGLTFSEMMVWSRVRQVSMLAHISTPKVVARKSSVDLGANPGGPSVEPVKFFPREYALPLLEAGHRRPGRERDDGSFNMRDQMIALLDGWGGLRRSEAFHLWVSDVTQDPDIVPDPDGIGSALIVLHHPSEGRVTYKDAFGCEVTSTREEYLNRECLLRPRHLVTRGRYHAGWKGMDLDKNLRTVVHWIDDYAGRIFYRLYLAYLNEVRRPAVALRKEATGRSHPFLFVSEGSSRHDGSRSMIGDPYSMQAYERNHRAAVKRLNLTYGKDFGTTTHGLRHMYGQTLMDLKVPAQVIKKCLHHRDYLSQTVYTAPTYDKVNATLSAAWKNIQSGEAVPIDLSGSETSMALHRLKEHITSGGPRG